MSPHEAKIGAQIRGRLHPPSQCPGCRALPRRQGVRFAAWAPNAARVAVVGDFRSPKNCEQTNRRWRAWFHLQMEHGMDARHTAPVHRRYHHDDMTFGLLYAFSENFIL